MNTISYGTTVQWLRLIHSRRQLIGLLRNCSDQSSKTPPPEATPTSDDSQSPSDESKKAPISVVSVLKSMTVKSSLSERLAKPRSRKETVERLRSGTFGEAKTKVGDHLEGDLSPEDIVGPQMVEAAKAAAAEVERKGGKKKAAKVESLLVDKLVETEVLGFEAARVPIQEGGGLDPLKIMKEMQIRSEKPSRRESEGGGPSEPKRGPTFGRGPRVRQERDPGTRWTEEAVREAAASADQALWTQEELAELGPPGTKEDRKPWQKPWRRPQGRDGKHRAQMDPSQLSGVPANLFNGQRLGFFEKTEASAKTDAKDSLVTWSALEDKYLRRLTETPPRNAYEEMIQWTQEGKLWTYPVDNEIMLEENKVGFYEHVFLEEQLEEGFPKTGPIRDFMELVCIGLSKNPYMNIAKKHAHIQWYRELFAEHQSDIERMHAEEKQQEARLIQAAAASASSPA